MYTPGRHTLFTRRAFTNAAVIAGTATCLPSFPAWPAGTADALCIMCIDHRLVNGGIGFFNAQFPAPRSYDLAAFAGASLAGVLSKFPESVPGFWKQIELAKALHDIRKVVVLDHLECGAFQQQFNDGKPMEQTAEIVAHEATMRDVRKAFRELYPTGMGLEFFIMHVENDRPGNVDPITL